MGSIFDFMKKKFCLLFFGLSLLKMAVLLNKVPKMRGKIFFSLNQKCSPYATFIINFQFQVYLNCLSGLNMIQMPMKYIGVIPHWVLDHLEPTQTVQIHLKFKIYYKTCIWGAFLILWKKKLPLSFGTLFSKTAIFSKESPKNNKQKCFFHKIKNAPHMQLL